MENQNVPRKKDISGFKFNKWNILCEILEKQNNQIMYLCECECGNFRIRAGNSVSTGLSKSCGCYNKEKISERSKKDLTGLPFGRLTVLCEWGRTRFGRVTWLCECSCGNFKIVVGSDLTSEHTKSCGCLHDEKAASRNKIDLTLHQIGKLTVIREYGRNKRQEVIWECICSCDKHNIVYVPTSRLTSKRTTSCGCSRIEPCTKIIKELHKIQKKENHPNWKGGSGILICKQCGKEFEATRSKINHGTCNFCSRKCLGKWNSENNSGKNNPSWLGGKSFEPYCPKFNNQKKEDVRNKYNRKCLVCGKDEKTNGRKLDVHHVDYDKDQGCDGKKWELVPLCKSCHSKTGNGNRLIWNCYIKYLIHYHDWKMKQ